MNKRYTKADLEQIVCAQLENLNAMHDLLKIMNQQNELLNAVNEKLQEELSGVKKVLYSGSRKRK